MLNSLYDLFVAPEALPSEIAEMDIDVMAEQVGELREAGVAEGMSNLEIAEAIQAEASE